MQLIRGELPAMEANRNCDAQDPLIRKSGGGLNAGWQFGGIDGIGAILSTAVVH